MSFFLPVKKNTRKFIINIINFLPPWIIYKIHRYFWFSRRYKIDFERSFKELFKLGENFSFIQIGGNDGISFDNLFEKIMERKSSGIILEPSPVYFEKLKFNYLDFPKIKLINKGVHPTSKNCVLFELDNYALSKMPEWGKGIGSFKLDHIKKYVPEESNIISHRVECINFNDLVKEFSHFREIDFLQIDTEGFDGEILRSIDFVYFFSKCIKFEVVNLEFLEKEYLKKILFQNGFMTFEHGVDYISFHKNFKIKFK